MKSFTKFLFIVLILSLAYHYFFAEQGAQGPTAVSTQPTAPIPPPPARQLAPASPGQPALVPNWPGAQREEQAGALESSLTKKNYVLIFDGSGSMLQVGCSGTRTKVEVAKEAVTEWAASLPVDVNLGLIVFDAHGFGVRLPLGENNRKEFAAEITKVVPNYTTPLARSLSTAYELLSAQGQKQLGYGEYTVVIVTDGIADDINALTAAVEKVLTQSPVVIHTIGFCINEEHSLNRQGRTVYRAANNSEELSRGLQDVLAESEDFDITGFE